MLSKKSSGPRVLIYDIEISPTIAYVWGIYEQNVIRVKQDWYMLSFAYKWLGERKTNFVSMYQDPKFKPNTTDDSFVVKKLHELFDEADIILAHNGDRFDRKKANSRFILNGLLPPSPYQTIDPLKVHRSMFGHHSNKLDHLGTTYDLGNKAEHAGFDTWLGCMAGDEKMWKLMEKYNKQDVDLLQAVYLKVLPWIVNHPNFAIWSDDRACPKCGSSDVIGRGYRVTKAGKYRTFHCKNCKSYSQSRTKEPKSGSELR